MVEPRDIAASLRRGLRDLPAAVQRWRVETGVDYAGHEAVWVWAMLRDGVDGVPFEDRDAIAEAVRLFVQERVPEANWVYVRFRGASERIPA